MPVNSYYMRASCLIVYFCLYTWRISTLIYDGLNSTGGQPVMFVFFFFGSFTTAVYCMFYVKIQTWYRQRVLV